MSAKGGRARNLSLKFGLIGFDPSWARDGSLVFDGSPLRNDEIASVPPTEVTSAS